MWWAAATGICTTSAGLLLSMRISPDTVCVTVSDTSPMNCDGNKTTLQAIQTEGEYGYGRIDTAAPDRWNEWRPDVAVHHESTNTTCKWRVYVPGGTWLATWTAKLPLLSTTTLVVTGIGRL